MIRRRVLLGVLLAVLFTLGWWAGRGRATSGLYSNVDLFVEVLYAVQSNYVDEPDPARLVQGGLNGMMRVLDASSEYLDAKDWKIAESEPPGDADGSGLFVGTREGWPVVIAPIEGSPAWRAGLAEGDIITRIDGHSAWGLGPAEIATRLRGPAGTTVTLSVLRGDAPHDRDLVLTRGTVQLPAVRGTLVLDGGVGYLRLTTFNSRASAQVRAALDTLRRAGARSLVLDLRGNPGGLPEQALGVAGSFLPAGSELAATRGRRAGADGRLVVPRGSTRVTWPMAVLVDGGTASVAEILAGSLQDLDRALLVGTNTFGSGDVQSLIPLRGGEGGVRLTTARYLTPSGRVVSRAASGTGDDEEAEDDPTLAAADTAAADSAARPEYRTASGRTVRGGGGIAPDLEAHADSLPPVAGAAAVRAALSRDAAFLRAAEVLRRAKGPADVFAFAKLPGPPATPPAATPRRASPPATRPGAGSR